ncbi:hypothetical protein FJMB80055_25610 [Enterobacter hormaechei]|nr:hypothetical protein OIPHN069_15550 [Enterobacter hormaechei subsp. hoffmannii]BDI77936.1 hypothetical protein FJMB80001_16070 [Enterobacter hormaechei]GJJ94113.1 hypothetical protein TUM16654_23930 [Enterobacter cloacae]BDI82899.1 hypothetical protein FJMB80002_16070 [Enterobacter hormaechei]BDI88400.1 hypothetical protein FJMB80003_22080 [Enterobacter hormaechei]
MAVATVPDGSNGMDHCFGREIARKRNNSMPRRALSLLLAHGFACFKELRARGPVNGTIHPAPTQEGGIGCVDDHVNVHRRDIAMNNVDLRSHKHPLQPAFFISVSQREKEKNCREKNGG